ncbi:MAG: CDP-alcohol phosphatidyltransferase family protein [Treponema sp.]|nr:CDP-alcohol phosphatidyltransferase family protein [Treponema sp.]
MSLSNACTLIRAVGAPVFFAIYFIPLWTGGDARWTSYAMIPLLACLELTDFFDGFFARRRNEVSDFGKIFDPFADVILHLTTFTCFLFSAQPASGAYLHPLLFMLIVYREFTMMFLRMAALKRGVAIAARMGGKVKTVLYVASGFFALTVETFLRNGSTGAPELRTAVSCCFALCVIASYASLADYLLRFRKQFF